MAKNNKTREFKDGDRNIYGLHYHVINPNDSKKENLCTFSGDDSPEDVREQLKLWKEIGATFEECYEVFRKLGISEASLRDTFNCL